MLVLKCFRIVHTTGAIIYLILLNTFKNTFLAVSTVVVVVVVDVSNEHFEPYTWLEEHIVMSYMSEYMHLNISNKLK